MPISGSAIGSPPYRPPENDRFSLNQAGSLSRQRSRTRQSAHNHPAGPSLPEPSFFPPVEALSLENSQLAEEAETRGRPASREPQSSSPAADRREPPRPATARRKGKISSRSKHRQSIETPATIQLRKASLQSSLDQPSKARIPGVIGQLAASSFSVSGGQRRKPSLAAIAGSLRQGSARMQALGAMSFGTNIHSAHVRSPLASPTVELPQGDYFGNSGALTDRPAFRRQHIYEHTGRGASLSLAAAVGSMRSLEAAAPASKLAPDGSLQESAEQAQGLHVDAPIIDLREDSVYEVIWHDQIAQSSISEFGSIPPSPGLEESQSVSRDSRSKLSSGSPSPAKNRSRTESKVSSGHRSRRDSGVFLKSGSWLIKAVTLAAPATTVLEEKAEVPMHLAYPTHHGSSFSHWDWDSTAPTASIRRALTSLSVYDVNRPTRSSNWPSPTRQSINSNPSIQRSLDELRDRPTEEQSVRMESEGQYPTRIESLPILPARGTTNDWITPLSSMESEASYAAELLLQDEEGRTRSVSLSPSEVSRSSIVQGLEDLVERDEFDAPMRRATNMRYAVPSFNEAVSLPVTRNPSSQGLHGLLRFSRDASRRTSYAAMGSALGSCQHKMKRSTFTPKEEILRVADRKRRQSDAERESLLKIIPTGVVKDRHLWIGGVRSGDPTARRSRSTGRTGFDGIQEDVWPKACISPIPKRSPPPPLISDTESLGSSSCSAMQSCLEADAYTARSKLTSYLTVDEIRKSYPAPREHLTPRSRQVLRSEPSSFSDFCDRDTLKPKRVSSILPQSPSLCPPPVVRTSRSFLRTHRQPPLAAGPAVEAPVPTDRSSSHSSLPYGYGRDADASLPCVRPRRYMPLVRARGFADNRPRRQPHAIETQYDGFSILNKEGSHVGSESLGMLGFGSLRAERDERAKEARGGGISISGDGRRGSTSSARPGEREGSRRSDNW